MFGILIIPQCLRFVNTVLEFIYYISEQSEPHRKGKARFVPNLPAELDLRLYLKNSPFAEGKHTFLKKFDQNFPAF